MQTGQRKRDPVGERHDLAFHPVTNPEPVVLSADDMAHFNEYGFVPPAQVLTPSEAMEVRTYIGDLLTTVVDAGDRRNSYSINTYHVACAGLHDLATHPAITGRVVDLLGPNVVCWGSHLFAKMPGDGKEVPFHQDAVFWPLTPSRSVTVWLAIDDVDDDNAPMTFVPASHSRGPLDHLQRDLDGSRVLGREVDPTGPNGLAQFGDARFADTMPAGWASMHSDLLLHGSAPNTSDAGDVVRGVDAVRALRSSSAV